MIVRPATVDDAAAIATIYNHYITETPVTFEEAAIDAGEVAHRIEKVGSASLPWLVAEENDQIAGYAYATRWNMRSGYRFSAEITVYLAHEKGGLGIGTMLYSELFSILESAGIRAVIGGIVLPNAASVALHEKFGMKKVAHFESVGFKFGQWLDVGYWERLL